ncbi:DUF721 domain-containing protein [Cereibacter sphaeroides]|uniref:DUF721 domain-containing protein n=1 Tax=Cereibacter sphaeroides TaxID=1063 RepID=UPI001F44B805|nr:DUF721 domain-containing protein [Cereibacter sphaeroides]MCE6960098.1 DUF721 domain-containing protein [Cereibacter sphaeroides]MCE6968641.1 DUF721 domain-containing protein [Cereibacter sphaeroides]MCE6973182.1 DUF721 domain-containing protein [Cereibacter sphaeroides]
MTRAPAPPQPKPTRRMRGFEPASGLLQDRIRMAGEKRGFAVTRLLTHWTEVAGEDLARVTRPVKVGYGAREGLGATLTVLVPSAHAPLVQMQLPALKQRVNACYGYAAINRIVLTQTAPSGFAEGQAAFDPAPKAAKPADPVVRARAAEAAAGVRDEGLRTALETLAQNFLSRSKA